MRLFWILACVLVALGVIDIVLTFELLSRGALEANPLLDWALSYGRAEFVLLKAGLTLGGIALLGRCKAVRPRAAVIALACLIAVYAAVDLRSFFMVFI